MNLTGRVYYVAKTSKKKKKVLILAFLNSFQIFRFFRQNLSVSPRFALQRKHKSDNKMRLFRCNQINPKVDTFDHTHNDVELCFSAVKPNEFSPTEGKRA